jgi:Fic family protein
MRLPQTPPKAETCLRFDDEIQRLASEIAGQKGYLHWEDLRRQKLPEGVRAEDVWGAIKRLRTPYASIAFGEGNSVFKYVQTSDILRRLHDLDRSTGGGLIPLPRDVLTDERRASYVIRSLIEESITSSQLEGAATTREVAREMIRQGRKPRDHNERMIFNNFLTMEFLRKNPPKELSIEAILEIHRRISHDVMEKPDAVGRFRRTEEPIRVETDDGTILHIPPAADQLEESIRMMCQFANSEGNIFIHPVIKAILLHFWLAYEHPFVDGNGRTARALFYWYMLKAGYDLFEFISISEILIKAPVKYGMAFLYTESDDNDLTYFIEHQLSVVEEAVEKLRGFVNLQLQRQEMLNNLMRAQMRFNHRQQDLLAHAIRHPGCIYTIKGHQNSHGVSLMTARNDLTELEKEGLLLKETRGRQFLFVVPKDVVERVRSYRN